jgi:hypothetical protein
MSRAEHLEAGRAGAGAADGHVACSMTSTRLRRLRHTHGPGALDSILELAGGVRSPDELEDVGKRQLTELLGHRAFHEALAEAVDDESRDPVTLALIDIDDFKQSNDDHGGHPVGDEALKSVANALRATVRDPDRLFRIGGEGVALLLPGLSAAKPWRSPSACGRPCRSARSGFRCASRSGSPRTQTTRAIAAG